MDFLDVFLKLERDPLFEEPLKADNRDVVVDDDEGDVREEKKNEVPIKLPFQISSEEKKFFPNEVQRTVNPVKNTTQKSAGVFVYCRKGGGVYVLLGKEKGYGYENEKTGLWNIQRGRVDPGETYVKAAARELEEETRGVYGLRDANQLLKSNYVFHKGLEETPEINAYTFFLEVEYVPVEDILSIRYGKENKNAYCFEMVDYAWVKVDDLVRAFSLPVKRARHTGVIFTAEVFGRKESGYSVYMLAYTFFLLKAFATEIAHLKYFETTPQPRIPPGASMIMKEQKSYADITPTRSRRRR